MIAGPAPAGIGPAAAAALRAAAPAPRSSWSLRQRRLDPLVVDADADRPRVVDLPRQRRVDVDRLDLRLRAPGSGRCQPSSYSVTSPNGTLTPSPKYQLLGDRHREVHVRHEVVLPASPPSSPSGWLSAGSEPSLLNLIDGVMMCSAPTACIGRDRDQPAGFDHMVLTSSVNAAPPANALPRPLPQFSAARSRRRAPGRRRSARAPPATAMAMRDDGTGSSLRWSPPAGCRSSRLACGRRVVDCFRCDACLVSIRLRRPDRWSNIHPPQRGAHPILRATAARTGVVASWHQHPLPTLTPAAARAAAGPGRPQHRSGSPR